MPQLEVKQDWFVRIKKAVVDNGGRLALVTDPPQLADSTLSVRWCNSFKDEKGDLVITRLDSWSKVHASWVSSAWARTDAEEIALARGVKWMQSIDAAKPKKA